MKKVSLKSYIYDFEGKPVYAKDMIDEYGRQGKLKIGIEYYNPVNQGIYPDPAEGRQEHFFLYDPAGTSTSMALTEQAYRYAEALCTK